ncbi:hypothetical protein K4K57_002433 [Colletotrichum sp. SAR 10_99]|nr:hypothetical protein K4K57_002433 [Colletotrichum sp. SAR 10_99]
MAMGIQQQNHHHQGSPPMFPGDFVDYGGQYETNDRQPRNTTNGAGNGRYRRPRSPSLDDDSRFTTGAPSEQTNSELHDAVLAQAAHQQQRVVPTTQPAGARTQARAAGPRSGPPSMANASQNRRSHPQPPPVTSQLPPYAGNPEDEWSPASRAAAAAAGAGGAAAGGYSRRRTERHARRQSSTSGAPTASDPALQMSGGASSSPRINANGEREHHQPQRAPSNPAGLRPPSPPTAGMNLGLAGDEISRLQSPSISKSVLEPLQRKMLEYHSLMEEAQGQMTQLDAELRALQERRRQAEQRFVDAKGKHDEYERQHLDVEKALRGDYAMPIPPPQQQQQQIHPQASQQQHQMYNDSPPRTLGRPASSIMSYDERPMSGRSSMQGKKGKFRISLFGR